MLFCVESGEVCEIYRHHLRKNRQNHPASARGQMNRVNSARIAAIKAEHAGLTIKAKDGIGCIFFLP